MSNRMGAQPCRVPDPDLLHQLHMPIGNRPDCLILPETHPDRHLIPTYKFLRWDQNQLDP